MEFDNSPMLPMIQIEQDKNGINKLWLHTNNLSERVELNNKNAIENFLMLLNHFHY